jgi:hypothetical protein
MYNADVISMPDKWEYPWYAAWDLAFHTIALALVDPDFAKDQLILFLREWYMHPNGQIPAYEWAFGDVNPPVHLGGATHRVEVRDGQEGPRSSKLYSSSCCNSWWVNRKDVYSRNVFSWFFLAWTISAPSIARSPCRSGRAHAVGRNIVDGDVLSQHDARSNLRVDSPIGHCVEVFEHFLLIGGAMTNLGGEDWAYGTMTTILLRRL